jgi:MFS family permease
MTPEGAPRTQIEEDRLYRKVIGRIVPLFFLGFVFSYLDRVNISLARLPMQRDFGLSEHAFSIGASVFFWGYMLCEVPSNLLLQRFGARAWISRIMVTWGLVSMLMVFSRNLTTFYSLRLLLGICEAGFVPGVLFYANQWLPTRRQSSMFALFLLALPVAEVVGAPFSGWVVEYMDGAADLHGWQWLFLVEGAPTVVLGIVIYAVLRNRPAEAGWLSDAERCVLARNLGDMHGKSHRLADAFRNPRVWLLITVMLLWNTSFYGLVFWLPTIVQNAGITRTSTVGLLTAIPFAVGGLVMVVTSRFAERIGRPREIATAAALIAAIGMFAAWLLVDHLALALAGLSVSVAGILALMPLYWTLPGRLLAGPAAAGGLALINSFGSFSGVLGVWVLGLAGISAGIAVFAGMLLACTVLLYFAFNDRPRLQGTLQAAPGFPVEGGGVDKLHAPFFTERR